jgi:hypothetical protein
MDKDVFAIFTLDKAKSFSSVKPLYCTGFFHFFPLWLQSESSTSMMRGEAELGFLTNFPHKQYDVRRLKATHILPRKWDQAQTRFAGAATSLPRLSTGAP